MKLCGYKHGGARCQNGVLSLAEIAKQLGTSKRDLQRALSIERNLSPIQRIAVAEKYRPIYEKQARENQSKAGGDKKSEKYIKSVTPNLVESINNRSDNETNSKLAKLAGVGKETYRMGAKVINSENEDLKQRVLSGEIYRTFMAVKCGKQRNYSVYISNPTLKKEGDIHENNCMPGR